MLAASLSTTKGTKYTKTLENKAFYATFFEKLDIETSQLGNHNPDERLCIQLARAPELETEYRTAQVLWPSTAHMLTLKVPALKRDGLQSHSQ